MQHLFDCFGDCKRRKSFDSSSSSDDDDDEHEDNDDNDDRLIQRQSRQRNNFDVTFLGATAALSMVTPTSTVGEERTNRAARGINYKNAYRMRLVDLYRDGVWLRCAADYRRRDPPKDAIGMEVGLAFARQGWWGFIQDVGEWDVSPPPPFRSIPFGGSTWRTSHADANVFFSLITGLASHDVRIWRNYKTILPGVLRRMRRDFPVIRNAMRRDFPVIRNAVRKDNGETHPDISFMSICVRVCYGTTACIIYGDQRQTIDLKELRDIIRGIIDDMAVCDEMCSIL